MAVEYLEIRDKLYPVKVGYYAIKKLQKIHKAKMTEIEENIELYEPLLFYSLEKGCKMEEVENPFKLKDMEDVLEEVWIPFSILITQAFNVDLEEKIQEVGGQTKPTETKKEK